MPFEFYCIIKNATYADQIKCKRTVEDEVARLANDAALVPRAFTAVTKMKTAYANSEFRTWNTPDPEGFRGDITKCCYQQALISQCSKVAMVLVCPAKDAYNICLGR